MLTGPKRRCSTGFHFDAPVGSWQTVTCSPYRSAIRSCNRASHSRGRWPLLPPAPVGQDHQPARPPVSLAPVPCPPRPDRLDGERRGVRRGADADVPTPREQVVDPVGHRPACGVAQEVVGVDLLAPVGTKTPGVLEVADQFHLLAFDALCVLSACALFGLSLCEGLWAGIPVLSTRTGVCKLVPGLTRGIPVGATGGAVALALDQDLDHADATRARVRRAGAGKRRGPSGKARYELRTKIGISHGHALWAAGDGEVPRLVVRLHAGGRRVRCLLLRRPWL